MGNVLGAACAPGKRKELVLSVPPALGSLVDPVAEEGDFTDVCDSTRMWSLRDEPAPRAASQGLSSSRRWPNAT